MRRGFLSSLATTESEQVDHNFSRLSCLPLALINQPVPARFLGGESFDEGAAHRLTLKALPTYVQKGSLMGEVSNRYAERIELENLNYFEVLALTNNATGLVIRPYCPCL
jgi:hypothetical protein